MGRISRAAGVALAALTVAGWLEQRTRRSAREARAEHHHDDRGSDHHDDDGVGCE
jgi:hypothetical protein